MTQGEEEKLEQWGDRVMEIAQRDRDSKVPGKVLQEQAILLFAMSCQGTRASTMLIESPPPHPLYEAVYYVKI